jgi:hypothetical protein
MLCAFHVELDDPTQFVVSLSYSYQPPLQRLDVTFFPATLWRHAPTAHVGRRHLRRRHE